MNSSERYIARTMFKLKVYESDGQAFEDLFIRIMSKYNRNFRPVKPYGRIGDMKNDGFDQVQGTYFQIYGPEEIEKRNSIDYAIRKLREDFYGLKEHWDSVCPIKEFYYVVNDKFKGIPAQIHLELMKLRNENLGVKLDVFGAKDLEDVFLALDEAEIQDIIGIIPNTDISFLNYDILNEAIDFIMSIETNWSLDNLNDVPDFEEKIKFNKLSDQISSLLNSASYQIGNLEQYFNCNSEFVKNELKSRFKGFYEESKIKIPDTIENFADQRFLYILDKASPSKKKVVIDAVLVLMAYYFETCDIFEEPVKVKEDDIATKTY